jgi:hypothetical protein
MFEVRCRRFLLIVAISMTLSSSACSASRPTLTEACREVSEIGPGIVAARESGVPEDEEKAQIDKEASDFMAMHAGEPAAAASISAGTGLSRAAVNYAYEVDPRAGPETVRFVLYRECLDSLNAHVEMRNETPGQ